MEIETTRTSIFCSDCPHKDAKKRIRARIEQRTFKTIEEHDAQFPKKPWLDTGAEHGINKTGIYRTNGVIEYWILEAPNLETLIRQLLSEVNEDTGLTDTELIIRTFDNNICIEIYDTWRE